MQCLFSTAKIDLQASEGTEYASSPIPWLSFAVKSPKSAYTGGYTERRMKGIRNYKNAERYHI